MRLVAEGVVVSFAGRARAVLDGADFEAGTGQTVAILGPSGSGKSTLLSVLGGLVRPSIGSVHVVDEASHDPRAPRDVTSWVLQTTNMLPERTALDNVAVAAQIAGVPRQEAVEQATDLLTSVGLRDLRRVPTRLLSGGEVQRVAVARALASRRPFILADEPTGQLDHSSTEVVLDALFTAVTAHGRQCGLVIVTHDPSVAERCDHTVRIEDGRVAA